MNGALPYPDKPAAAPEAYAEGSVRKEFLRMVLTIWVRCAAGMGRVVPAGPWTASERCLACVLFRTSFESVRFSCCSRERA